jgi:uncharacterized protein (TIGR04255 family)
MKLPVSIDPCPISETVAEVRFETPVPEDAVFGLVYQALKADFPKSTTLPAASLLPEVRKSDPNLAIQPLHRLDGEHLTVMVGSQAVTVGIRKGYPGWTVVSKRFRETFARLANTELIGKPLRFGLRYINFFQGDIFPKLTLSIAINNDPINGAATQLRTVLQAHGCGLLLQVSKDVMLVGEQKRVGSVIDIDSFVTEPDAAQGFEDALAEFLEKAHLAEKELFFGLLKEDFLATLNPTYAHAD